MVFLKVESSSLILEVLEHVWIKRAVAGSSVLLEKQYPFILLMDTFTGE